MRFNTWFDCTPYPVVAVGEFENHETMPRKLPLAGFPDLPIFIPVVEGANRIQQAKENPQSLRALRVFQLGIRD
jgi:hypothetical protein